MNPLFASLDRRAFLSIGGLGLFAAAEAAGADSRRSRARAKSVIFLHQFGGPSHVDSFDMKPSAPEQVRGIYQPIRSRLPGVPVCDRLPHMAQVMDKVTLVRSVRHEMKNHNSAGYYSLTGAA